MTENRNPPNYKMIGITFMAIIMALAVFARMAGRASMEDTTRSPFAGEMSPEARQRDGSTSSITN